MLPGEPYPPSEAIDSRGSTVVRELQTQTDVGMGFRIRGEANRSPRIVVGPEGLVSTDSGEVEIPKEPVASRYRVIRSLGQGSGGVVYEAIDEFGGEEVALKILYPGSGLGTRRVAREIAALRVLDLPGVARLLDEGVHNGQRFIVMTLVRGKSFPGDQAMPSWRSLATPTMALLETLHRVHEQGIIHRDLKPSNVLVDEMGRPVILDFGLARGSRLGDTITHSGAILGTPRYQAPEQMEGRPADARSDLYAVGVMLFEALAGHPPHEADTVDALRFRRVSTDAPPLSREAPDAPPGVAAVVDWLLARDPAHRPQTAAEVLTALQADADAEHDELLPWLGPRAPIEAIVTALLEQRSVDLGGPQGSGRTRILREAMNEVDDAVEVEYLDPGQRPFQSLAAIVDLEKVAGPDPDALLVNVDRVLEERLRGGLVIVADDIERLDRWTVEALDRCRGFGTVLRVVGEDKPCDLAVEPLTAEDLRDLFVGPDRLLHFKEDGSRELFARTSGVPLRIVREVAAWVGAGMATWRNGRLAITRESLRRLAARPRLASGDAEEWLSQVTGSLAELMAWITLAWPHATPARLQAATGRPGWEIGVELAELVRLGAVVRRADGTYDPRGPALELPLWPFERRRAAHLKLAELIEPGATGRLGHLIAAGTAAQIADEALVASRKAELAGQLGDGLGIVSEALPAVRALGSECDEARLLVELANLALSEQTQAAMRRAHYELERRLDIEPMVARMDALLRAALTISSATTDDVFAQVAAVGPFEELRLEVNRQMVRFVAAQAEGTERMAELLAELEPWAEKLPPNWRGYYDGWVGKLRYRQLDFDGALRLHRQAEERRPDAGRALGPRINAAIALVEAFRLDEAEALAEEVRDEGIRLRLPLYEAYAEMVLSVVKYRRKDDVEPDLELSDAAVALEHADIAANILLNQAAIAWRRGDRETAARLARGAKEHWAGRGSQLSAGLARALELVAVGEADEAEISSLAEQGREAAMPRLGAQILGLISQVAPDSADHWHRDARRLARSTPEGLWGHRLEVLSLHESVADSDGKNVEGADAEPAERREP